MCYVRRRPRSPGAASLSKNRREQANLLKQKIAIVCECVTNVLCSLNGKCVCKNVKCGLTPRRLGAWNWDPPLRNKLALTDCFANAQAHAQRLSHTSIVRFQLQMTLQSAAVATESKRWQRTPETISQHGNRKLFLFQYRSQGRTTRRHMSQVTRGYGLG